MATLTSVPGITAGVVQPQAGADVVAPPPVAAAGAAPPLFSRIMELARAKLSEISRAVYQPVDRMWRDITNSCILIALVITIVGAIYCFFMGQALLCGCFVFLLLTDLFCLGYILNTANLITLGERVGDLGTVARQLKASSDKLERGVATHGKQITAQQEVVVQLQQGASAITQAGTAAVGDVTTAVTGEFATLLNTLAEQVQRAVPLVQAATNAAQRLEEAGKKLHDETEALRTVRQNLQTVSTTLGQQVASSTA